MILRLDQLDTICDAAFPFDASFLKRMETAFREFIEADGMLAAGESPGPLTELRENKALLLLVLDSAKERTTAEDHSRAGGIVALTRMMNELESLCRRKTGLTLAELDEQFARAAAEETHAPDTPASEGAQIDECLTSIRERIGQQIIHGCDLIRHAGPPPLPARQEALAREAWNVATQTHRSIAALPSLDGPTMDALTDLQTLTDALRDLLP